MRTTGIVLLVACAAALHAGCSSHRGLKGLPPGGGPHALVAHGTARLRSETIDLSLRYHEGGDDKFPFALFRVKNLTRAPIYPDLNRLRLRRRGGEDQALHPACDRDRTTVARLAPREAHWCGEYANPGHSIDVPVGLFEIPPQEAHLEFDLVIPIVFDTGEPVEVAFSNRVGRSDWQIFPPAPRSSP